jgi:hypothetical protein
MPNGQAHLIVNLAEDECKTYPAACSEQICKYSGAVAPPHAKSVVIDTSWLPSSFDMVVPFFSMPMINAQWNPVGFGVRMASNAVVPSVLPIPYIPEIPDPFVRFVRQSRNGEIILGASLRSGAYETPRAALKTVSSTEDFLHANRST